MKYICVQPAIDYYTWQVEVMINNFIKNGINPNHIEIVCAYYNEIPAKWSKLANTYNTVRFFFYKDARPRKNYISSVRPYILHQHWLRYPELETETIFYHDCDIILSKKAEFSKLEKDDVCYVSDTISYIGANYILSKGERYLNLMTNIVGINKDVVIENELDSGGAQYILKNIPAKFWNKVYEDAETLWTRVNTLIHQEKPDHAIQIWCADMWAVLWNLWLLGKQVKVTEKMSFSWATSGIYDWDKYPIHHNAGVVGDTKDMFFKGKFQKTLPFDHIKIDDLNKQMCNYKYAEEVLKIKEVSCLIK